MKSELAGAGEEIEIEFLHLDLSSLQSARDFAAIFISKGLPLHVLILNAGIGIVDLGKSVCVCCQKLVVLAGQSPDDLGSASWACL